MDVVDSVVAPDVRRDAQRLGVMLSHTSCATGDRRHQSQ